MKIFRKVCVCVCLIVVAFLAFPFAQAAESTAESTVPQQALSFLEEVVQLDVSKYNVTLASNSFDYIGPPILPELVVHENVKYELAAQGSKVNAIFIFKNGTIAWCSIYTIEGTPIYKEHQPTNDLDRAKNVLERYQNTIGIPGFTSMRDLLNTVDKLESTVKTSGSMKLEITQESDTTRFEWFHGYGGVDTEALSIRIQNGNVRYITNYLCLTKVGGTEVKISEEQAVNIAREYAKSFSWKANTGSEELVEVKDFKILESPVKTKLSMQPRESFELYPYWYVELCLDKVYPGSVSSIHVGLWADTGAVNYCHEISAGAAYPPDEPQTKNTIPIGIPIVAIISVAILAIAIATIIIKKRRK
ncbi:hypothetical protein IMZ68_04770 [Candidatus Bathyarchaeota archaeon]|nr:hypothetical protein [Candidatus Bathyarchaeota archaeon]